MAGKIRTTDGNNLFQWPGATREFRFRPHSYLSASTGSSRAAFTAG
jgi:hypothetical protein